MTTDNYNTIINSPSTYKEIAKTIFIEGAIVFGWTDEASTHLDILMTWNPPTFGELYGGQRKSDLFVAVSRYGMFGFDTENGSVKYPAYVGEKLGLGDVNETTEKLAELINGVIGVLKDEYGEA